MRKRKIEEDNDGFCRLCKQFAWKDEWGKEHTCDRCHQLVFNAHVYNVLHGHLTPVTPKFVDDLAKKMRGWSRKGKIELPWWFKP